MSLRSAAFLAVLLLLGCRNTGSVDDAGGDADACAFFGVRDLALEAELGYRATDGSFVPLTNGDALPLVRPVQGGHCAFPAARMRNLCRKLRLSATLRDSEDRSEGPFVVDTDGVEADGWILPDMELDSSAVPNVCTCPNYWFPTLLGADIIVDLTVTDRVENRTVSLFATVVPACLQDAPKCAADCECDCGPDGTTPGACPRFEGDDCDFQ